MEYTVSTQFIKMYKQLEILSNNFVLYGHKRRNKNNVNKY